MTEHTAPRILISRMSAIGDAILTLPVACAIREHFPEAAPDVPRVRSRLGEIEGADSVGFGASLTDRRSVKTPMGNRRRGGETGEEGQEKKTVHGVGGDAPAGQTAAQGGWGINSSQQGRSPMTTDL